DERDDRLQPNHITLDLTLEILSRLPAKSILRYRCVSKAVVFFYHTSEFYQLSVHFTIADSSGQ
ncbi:unnamed protein product, partial [Brassica oleracea var. botrytis]